MIEPSEPGVRRCLTCGLLFVSPDIERIRRCFRCKRNGREVEYDPPFGVLQMPGLSEALRIERKDSFL